MKYGGDVSLLSSLGTTALHMAVSEENAEIVKFLVEQGADIDKPDVHGWSPRALADYQGNEEINEVLRSKEDSDRRPVYPEPKGPCLKKYQSESAIPPLRTETQEPTPPQAPATLPAYVRGGSSVSNHPKWRTRMVSSHRKSLIGFMSVPSSANEGEDNKNVAVSVSCMLVCTNHLCQTPFLTTI